MDCSPPSSSVHGILQARILEWVAMPSSRGSSQPRDPTRVSRIAGGFFTTWATREAQGRGSLRAKCPQFCFKETKMSSYDSSAFLSPFWKCMSYTALGKGMETHSSVLGWRIRMDRGAWWATVHGVTKSQTWLSMQYRMTWWKQGPSTFYGIFSLATDSPEDLGLAWESVFGKRRLSGRSERGWEHPLALSFPVFSQRRLVSPKGEF